jgi:predicted XRE-type DNA-binding protein
MGGGRAPRRGGSLPIDLLPKEGARRAALLEVWASREQITEAEEDVVKRRQQFVEALWEARRQGVSPTDLAEFLGVTRSRLHQLLGKKPQRP